MTPIVVPLNTTAPPPDDPVPAGANPTAHREFAVVISVAAALVAWLGFFEPVRLDRAFTWAELPPLHARFVASLYLFGAVLVGASAVVRHRAQWGGVVAGIAIFTTSMLVLTALNPDAFDWALGPVRGWVISYVVYPPIAWTLTVWLARRPLTSPGGAPVPGAVTALLRTVAAAFGLVGLALLTMRETMADVWPWPVSAGVAQFYGGPLLSVAWVAGWYSARRHRRDLAAYAPAVATLGIAVTVVSIRHRQLFSAGDPAAWVWFAVFATLGVTHLVLTIDIWRHRRT